jgi:hypothetical protein
MGIEKGWIDDWRSSRAFPDSAVKALPKWERKKTSQFAQFLVGSRCGRQARAPRARDRVAHLTSSVGECERNVPGPLVFVMTCPFGEPSVRSRRAGRSHTHGAAAFERSHASNFTAWAAIERAGVLFVRKRVGLGIEALRLGRSRRQQFAQPDAVPPAAVGQKIVEAMLLRRHSVHSPSSLTNRTVCVKTRQRLIVSLNR